MRSRRSRPRSARGEPPASSGAELARAVLALTLLCLPPLPAQAQPPVTLAAFDPLVAELQAVVAAADAPGFLALLAPAADVAAAREFAHEALRPGISRAVVAGRFATPVEDAPEGDRHRLAVEVFTERGDRGRLQTWQLDVTRAEAPGGMPGPWRIAAHDGPHALDGLYHLALSTDRQFDAGGLEIAAEDMRLRMTRGAAFVAEIDAGVTGLVLVGDGVLTFAPQPAAERRQVEIFSGQETLEARFTQAFVRVNPVMLDARLTTDLAPAPVGPGLLEQAQAAFDELAGLTFVVDLSDFSDRTWWLTPRVDNFVAEIVTREHGRLTYTQAEQQPEDISLYMRDPARVIALYPSARKRAARGRYHDRAASFDVLDYDVEAAFEPRGVGRESLGARPTLLGCWIDATVRLALRVGDAPLTSLTLQLAEALRVHSVTSRELGALLFLRMRGRNDVVVNLPAEAPAGTEFTLLVRYSGLLEADELEENWIGRMRLLDRGGSATYGIPERRYLYTNASRWYPQPAAADYATATMTLTIPADYGVIASGDPDDGNPPLPAPGGARGTRTFSFVTVQPARYLSCVITRFARHETPAREIVLDRAARDPRQGVSYDSLTVAVEANAFGREHVPGFAARAEAILRFYASLVGDVPYPTFTLALTDSRLPGGHSPAYFVVLNQPLPVHGRLIRTWRTDPVAFSGYPSFFLAHELAHQWWGQAVGWKNYHEQWLSEGLAQYFAALYAREEHGEDAFTDVLGQLRRWSLRHADQGPVDLGYRLGHLAEEPRVFRALVYNKSALVLHMLRRLIGDDAFFRGLRRFYTEMRFRVAGTDDLMRAFEIESARSLEDFFGRWIHGFDLPRLRFDYRTEARAADPGATDVVLRFRQEGELFELPVTVTLRYRSGAEESVVVAVVERTTEARIPLRGPLRDLHVNRDHAALAEIHR